jgi:hypothetical protein
MTNIRLADDSLQITFPGWEQWVSGRPQLTVPHAAITSVEVLPDWSNEILGWRSGLSISRYLKLGAFTHPSGRRRLVAMRRGRPLLPIGLRDSEFDELLISDVDARWTAAALPNPSAA